MTDQSPPASKRRGRPRNETEAERAAIGVERALTKAGRDTAVAALDEAERPKHVAVADALSPDQRGRLAAGLGAIAEVKLLQPERREKLLSELVCRLPFCVVATAMVPEGITSKRGRKPKLGVAHLLVDCVKAWEVATGDLLKIWESSHYQREAVPCKIARVAIQVLGNHGAPYSGALHTHIRTARLTLEMAHTSILDRLSPEDK